MSRCSTTAGFAIRRSSRARSRRRRRHDPCLTLPCESLCVSVSESTSVFTRRFEDLGQGYGGRVGHGGSSQTSELDPYGSQSGTLRAQLSSGPPGATPSVSGSAPAGDHRLLRDRRATKMTRFRTLCLGLDLQGSRVPPPLVLSPYLVLPEATPATRLKSVTLGALFEVLRLSPPVLTPVDPRYPKIPTSQTTV